MPAMETQIHRCVVIYIYIQSYTNPMNYFMPMHLKTKEEMNDY